MITGINIKQLRESMNQMTQQELADKIGVTRQMIVSWENGSTISRKRVEQLCEIFKVDPEYFQESTEQKTVTPSIMEELIWQNKKLIELLDKALSFQTNFPEDRLLAPNRKIWPSI